MRQMVEKGCNIARFNLSHVKDRQQIRSKIEAFREICNEFASDNPVAIVLDTRSGREIRTTFRDYPIEIEEGGYICFASSNSTDPKEVMHDGKMIPRLALRNCDMDVLKKIKMGDYVSLQDDEVKCIVKELAKSEDGEMRVVAEVTDAMKKLRPGTTSVYLPPDLISEAPLLAPEDEADLEALGDLADGVLLSFVESGKEVAAVRKRYPGLQFYAKIESVRGIEAAREIMWESSGVMVARGDLSMALSHSQRYSLAGAQKQIVQLANSMAKPVWVATHLLESMIDSKKPTYAELADISNAVVEGSDVLMVSGETAQGKFPLQVVEMLHEAIVKAEEMGMDALNHFVNAEDVRDVNSPQAIEEICAKGAAAMAKGANCKVIICITQSGMTARLLAAEKPEAKILMLTDSERVQRRLLQVRSIHPILVTQFGSLDVQLNSASEPNAYTREYVRQNSGMVLDQFVDYGITFAKDSGLAKTGDLVLICRLMPQGYDQMIRLQVVS